MEEKEYTGFKVLLDKFEGPLDLLLHLVKQEQIDVKDIFISQVTDEYLKIVFSSSGEGVDMEKMTDFIDMAATLIEIKSRSLLPQDKKEELEEEDPEKKLIRQLEEYKLFKEASVNLRTIENLDSFHKEVSPIVGKVKTIFTDTTLQALIDAFQNVLIKVKNSSTPIVPKEVQKERHTVEEQLSFIKSTLKRERKVSFFKLFKNDTSREECIVTFLALLELLRLNVIKSIQSSNFGDIDIEYKSDVELPNSNTENI